MRLDRKGISELILGASLIAAGFLLMYWATSLVWIQAYPPPLGKQVLDAMPPILWAIGVLLLADGLRRLAASEGYGMA